MNKYKLQRLVPVVIALLATSLGLYWQHSRTSPTGVAKRYLSALQTGNFNAAYALVASSSKKFIDLASFEQYQRQNHGDAWGVAAVHLKNTTSDHIVVGWKEVRSHETTDSHLDLIFDQGVWRIAHTGTFYPRLVELHKSKQYKALLEVTDAMNQIAPWDGEISHRRSLALMNIAKGMPAGPARQEAIVKALDMARETAKRLPDEFQVQLELGYALMESKLDQEAEGLYSRAINLASNPQERGEALVERANVRLNLKRTADAVADVKEALRIAPDNDFVRNIASVFIPLAAPLGVDLRLPEKASHASPLPKEGHGAGLRNGAMESNSSNIAWAIIGFLSLICVVLVFRVIPRRGPPSSDGKDSKTKTTLIWAGLAISVFAAAIMYWNYMRSPQYSLWMAAKAIKQHDITTFEKYTDVDGLSSRLIDQIMEQATQNNSSPKNRWEQVGEALAKGFVGMIKPRMVESAKEQIERYIENGEFENSSTASEEKSPSTVPLKEVYSKIAGEKDGFRGIQYIKKDGKIASVGLGFYREDYDKMLVLDLKMRDKGGYWQIAEISNFTDLIRQANELESGRAKKLNASIVELMSRTLVIQKISKKGKTTRDGKVVAFSVDVMNAGLKGIAGLKVAIKSADGGLSTLDATFTPAPLGPGQSVTVRWQQSVNESDGKLMRFFTMPQEKLGLTAEIEYIKFVDGNELKLK